MKSLFSASVVVYKTGKTTDADSTVKMRVMAHSESQARRILINRILEKGSLVRRFKYLLKS